MSCLVEFYSSLLQEGGCIVPLTGRYCGLLKYVAVQVQMLAYGSLASWWVSTLTASHFTQAEQAVALHWSPGRLTQFQVRQQNCSLSDGSGLELHKSRGISLRQPGDFTRDLWPVEAGGGISLEPHPHFSGGVAGTDYHYGRESGGGSRTCSVRHACKLAGPQC